MRTDTSGSVTIPGFSLVVSGSIVVIFRAVRVGSTYMGPVILVPVVVSMVSPKVFIVTVRRHRHLVWMISERTLRIIGRLG